MNRRSFLKAITGAAAIAAAPVVAKAAMPNPCMEFGHPALMPGIAGEPGRLFAGVDFSPGKCVTCACAW
jgi:hypothetical protein